MTKEVGNLMRNEEFAAALVRLLGGRDNILHVENCMTRLRVRTAKPSQVELSALKRMDGVLGVIDGEPLQVVLPPEKAQKVADLIAAMGIVRGSGVPEDWESARADLMPARRENGLKASLRGIGEIFIPLIPAIIAAGTLNGLSDLIVSLQKSGTLPETAAWSMARAFLGLMGTGFFAYFAVFTGMSAAKRFGATEALGGMIGGISILPSIDGIAKILGLFKGAVPVPLESLLRSGKVGVIGVILGVWVLAKVERWGRRHIPDVLDLLVTPIVSLVVSTGLMVCVIMPASGFLSDGLIVVLNPLLNSSNAVVQVLSGYALAAFFVPIVLLGLHHGLVPLYALQLQALEGVSLFPVLAMAGAGQVGAALALYIKAVQVGNHRLKRVIAGALPAGLLGVGDPLIYGVTLPLGRPFLTAGIGAGFGGAYVMAAKVLFTAWGPSGLTAIPFARPECVRDYVMGLLIAYLGGFLTTGLFVKPSDTFVG